MKKVLLIIFLFVLIYTLKPSSRIHSTNTSTYTFWPIQSIDTMKFSRDVAREKLHDASFDAFINATVKNIAAAGATHIALGTPYDPEFIPFLTRWVDAARRHNLKVWFRGNMSGWEGWFEYEKIDRAQHTAGILTFIDLNKDLFEDGDIFTSCPECENGGPGDPRHNNDLRGHQEFLINEYTAVKQAFKKINKSVQANTYSMNGDVTKLVMDSETTHKLDGVIVPDHYVKSPEKTLEDLRMYAQRSGGKVILGEFGIPIPDIHGEYSEDEQSAWLETFFNGALEYPEIIGFNYWTSMGGSTQIWNADGSPRKAVATIRKYFKPEVRRLRVNNLFGRNIRQYSMSYGKGIKTIRESDGSTAFIFIPNDSEVTISANNYTPIKIRLSDMPEEKTKVNLELIDNNFYSKLRAFFGF